MVMSIKTLLFFIFYVVCGKVAVLSGIVLSCSRAIVRSFYHIFIKINPSTPQSL